MNSSLIIISSFTLNALGLIIIYSSSAIECYFNHATRYYFVGRQFIYILLGILIFIIVQFIELDTYKMHAYNLYLLTVFLLSLVLVPGIGKTAGGAARWLSFNFFDVQPGEIFKFTLVVYLAMSLSRRYDVMGEFRRGVLPNIIFPGLLIGLVISEPDFGTAFVGVAVTIILVYIAGARIHSLFWLVVVIIPTALGLVISSQYRIVRVISYLNPWDTRESTGFQIIQSLIAVSSGNFFGFGLGKGPAKLGYLPSAHTDFVLATIGQELGLVGIFFVSLCFFVLFVSGIKLYFYADDFFEKFLAAGISTSIALDAILNMYVSTGIVPTKGLALPFVSYGGSSLLIKYLMIGVLFKIAKKAGV